MYFKSSEPKHVFVDQKFFLKKIAVLWTHISFNVDQGPAFYLNADPDPGIQTNADPDPGIQANADPYGSGSCSEFAVTKSWTLFR
jgi:hypothetical protein